MDPMEYALCLEFPRLIFMLTSLPMFIEKPFFEDLFLSKIVFRWYFEDAGEDVKSLVKSDFLPYPIAVPLFLNDDYLS